MRHVFLDEHSTIVRSKLPLALSKSPPRPLRAGRGACMRTRRRRVAKSERESGICRSPYRGPGIQR
eukprot:scaffold49376_cov32-Tisochrysis_lutea.AAC.1